MASLIYGSSQTDPNYANFQGSLTYAPKSVTAQIPYQTTGPGVVSGFNSFSSPSPSGGGGGGGGSSGLDPHINPATGAWDDNYYAANNRSSVDAEAAARAAAQAELDAALGELNYQKEGLQAQSGQLDTQRLSALGTVDTEYGRARTTAEEAKTEAKEATASAANKALSTAQDVTRKNRNVLRALGILSSSAGGEILTKAMTEYGTQAGELQTGLLKRLQTVEDWWKTRTEDFTKLKTDIESQYATMKENIARDLRFNDTQRLTAVKAAAAAAQQRQYEISQQMKSYQLAAQQYSDNLLMQLAQIKMYQNPSADISSIYNQLLSSAQGANPRQVGVSGTTGQTDEQRRLAMLSSGLGTTTR